MNSWKFVVPLLACVTLCHSILAQQAGIAETKPDAEAQPDAAAKPDTDAAFWQSVFAEHHVLEIALSVSQESWDAMQPVRAGRDNTYPYAKAAITIDGKAFADAGLRFKGNSSFRASAGSAKRPFKIDLNRFIKAQKLHGRSKLNLSNSFLDPAFMKEKLGYEFYRAAGLATPGVGWANVTLTIAGGHEKQSLGIYVVVEQVDERFLASKLGQDSAGSLMMKPERTDDWQYLGDEPEAYARYDIKSGDQNVAQVKTFAELLQLIETGSDEQFASQIGERVDLEQFAAYLAATCILVNVDSYVGMPHNYYLVVDRADNKLRILPWDLNECFGTFSMGQDPEQLARWDIDRPWIAKRRLLERLFAMEPFQKLYRTTLERLVQQEFTKEKMFARIDAFAQALVPVMTANAQQQDLADLRMGIDGDIAGLNAAVERRVLAIKPFISKRIESLQAQLKGSDEGVTLRPRRR